MDIQRLQSDYVNGQNYRCLDVWFTPHEDEEGTTVAYFCEDTGKSLIPDVRFRNETVITTTLETLKQDFDLIQLHEKQLQRRLILEEIKESS